MIVGAGKKLKKVRTILSNDVNDIFVCQNVEDKKDTSYYTLIRVHNDKVIKDILEIIYDEDGTCNLPKSLFCGLFVEVDTLNILMKYEEPRKLFSYLKSYMNNDYSQHTIIKNFLYKCLLLDVTYPILNLILDKDNINLDDNMDVFFNCFLDFSKFNKEVTEGQCVRKCCDLIYDMLMVNEELTEKSKVKAVNLFVKKKRNNDYRKMIELYNDFKIKENKYKNSDSNILENIKDSAQVIYQKRFKRWVFSIGVILIVSAMIIFVCNLFQLDLPFTRYQGMNVIGTVNMGEK